ncbi:hypothetical protein FRD01_13120 [Microvenator marinus]|uniref:Exopolysaccharide biosynthesis protein YbjH n=1 Tax=Microvenator marinus TaxID=2600177 RepID=A0A5B8XRH9_9DELT|nr:hypothetical protein [Microvenator marinus]QED28154.1 hypothetical protein FRD01_13120 [Microvenator marinus]
MKNRSALIYLAFFAATFLSSTAFAWDFENAIEDGAVLGLGTQNLASVSIYGVLAHAHEDANDTDPAGSYGIHFELAGLPFFTLNEGFFGVEAEGTFGLPWNYFGGLNMSGGALISPLRLPFIKPSLGFGVGFGSHYYGYIQPRVAASLEVIDIEFAAMWIPQFASHIAGEGGLTEPGIGHLRLRGSVYIPFGEANDLGSRTGLRVFVERHSFAGQADLLIEKNVVPGDYWGGGIGAAF